MAKFQVKKDSRGEFRWTFYANNGEAIAVSSEGYVRKADCLTGIQIVKTQSPAAPTEDQS